jgi:hypothetical protein
LAHQFARESLFCDELEIIFLDDGSSVDGSFEEMQHIKTTYPEYNVKLVVQPGLDGFDSVVEAHRGNVLYFDFDGELVLFAKQKSGYHATFGLKLCKVGEEGYVALH